MTNGELFFGGRAAMHSRLQLSTTTDEEKRSE